jgi:hypothetical protein
MHMGNERVFRDINGIEWRVSHVGAPATYAGSLPPDDGADGWLSFETGWMERRLAPVPKNWHTATIQRLEQMCRIATAVQRDHTAIPTRPSSLLGNGTVEATADTTPAEGSSAVTDEMHAIEDHMSLLANTWPARENRVTFRG